MEDLPAPRLEARDLRVVLALAAAGSTARAAATLHLTQPAVSRALLAIEARLGARLFDRVPGGLALTDVGRRFVAGAPRLLADLADFERQVIAPGPVVQVRLVCECYTAYHWLPTALVALRADLPGIEIELAIEHSGDPIAAMAADEVDVALVTGATVPRTLREAPLFGDEIVFVVAADHPLARRPAVTAADLRTHVLLTSSRPGPERQAFVKRAFGRARPQVRIQFVPLTEACLDLARAGQGVAVLSEWIARPHLGHGELVARSFGPRPMVRPWRMAWRPPFEGVAQRLRTALQGQVGGARLGRLAAAR
ncbi:MAG: LysR family transcriptional regulator [Deltaproteobacteria bacterium]|nr:LysR family transcriptional regulator [Deltaproteobacteria bacterium]